MNPSMNIPAEDKVPFAQKFAYGLGSFTNNMLAQAVGAMMIVLTIGYGVNPFLVGLLGSIPRLTDALTDPIVGYLSDRYKSKWGRRRPFIFVGAIGSGLLLMIMWQLPDDQSTTFYFVYFLLLSFVFFLAYTVFATPWVALGYELTPNYIERTRVMGLQNFIGQTVFLLVPWFLLFMSLDTFGDIRNGASVLAVILGFVCIGFGIVPAIVIRERFADRAASEAVDVPGSSFYDEVSKFFNGFLITIKNLEFLKLAGATFLVFNGFMMVAGFQPFIVIYYLCDGDTTEAGIYTGYFGVITSIFTFIAIAFATWLSGVVGKQRAFHICVSISILGYASKWFLYNPDNPLLICFSAPFIAFGLGCLFTLMSSMIADICDFDELETHQRREGMYGSIFWWVVKLGMAAALAIGGAMLVMTGFDVGKAQNQTEQTFFWMRVLDVMVPVVTSVLALVLVSRYKLNAEMASDVRARLEARRAA